MSLKDVKMAFPSLIITGKKFPKAYIITPITIKFANNFDSFLFNFFANKFSGTSIIVARNNPRNKGAIIKGVILSNAKNINKYIKLRKAGLRNIFYPHSNN